MPARVQQAQRAQCRHYTPQRLLLLQQQAQACPVPATDKPSLNQRSGDPLWRLRQSRCDLLQVLRPAVTAQAAGLASVQVAASPGPLLCLVTRMASLVQHLRRAVAMAMVMLVATATAATAKTETEGM